jgi:SPP1 gp7 family putative phage head morphogenesis protein
MDNLARLGLGWNRLPADAFANFIGISGDGQPVGRLLAELGSDAAPQVRAAIGEGIALGKGPRPTAQLVRVAAGMPLSRALRITRTETNRAYREATRLQYASNSQVVKGYRRHAAKEDTTCLACIALDGELYALDEPLNEHPNGRCALVPDVLDYEDLGLDLPPTPQPETARDWLRGQPESVQRDILGARRFDAIQSGQIDLEDLATVRGNRVWGDAAVVRPISELGI